MPLSLAAGIRLLELNKYNLFHQLRRLAMMRFRFAAVALMLATSVAAVSSNVSS